MIKYARVHFGENGKRPPLASSVSKSLLRKTVPALRIMKSVIAPFATHCLCYFLSATISKEARIHWALLTIYCNTKRGARFDLMGLKTQRDQNCTSHFSYSFNLFLLLQLARSYKPPSLFLLLSIMYSSSLSTDGGDPRRENLEFPEQPRSPTSSKRLSLSENKTCNRKTGKWRRPEMHLGFRTD